MLLRGQHAGAFRRRRKAFQVCVRQFLIQGDDDAHAVDRRQIGQAPVVAVFAADRDALALQASCDERGAEGVHLLQHLRERDGSVCLIAWELHHESRIAGVKIHGRHHHVLQVRDGTALLVHNVFAGVGVDPVDEIHRPIQTSLSIDHDKLLLFSFYCDK